MNRTYAVATVLSANAVSYKGQMAIASRALDDFDRQGRTTSSNVAKVGNAIKIAFAAAAIAVGALAFSAVSMAADFDRAMRNVNSISMLSERALASLSNQVVQLSTAVPQSARQLAEGLYDIASSGFQGAEGLQVLEVSAKAASAGLSTTQTAAKAVVAVLNAYGLSASDAERVSDVLFQTVNVGVVSFDELASQLGDVVGIAAAAGIEIDEVGAAVAAMTLAGISAAESTTSLNRVIQGIIDPSEELGNLFHNLGFESGKAALDTLGLHGTMERLREVTGGNVEALLKLFPEVRSARGAFALMSAEGQNYATTFAAITDEVNVAGATQRAFSEQMKGLSNQVDLFVNRIKAGLITLGTKAIPVLIDALARLQTFGEDLIEWGGRANEKLGGFFTSMLEAGRNIGSLLRNLAADLRPVVTLLAALGAAAVVGALTGFATGLSAVTGFLDRFHFALVAVGTYLLTRWVVALGIGIYYQAAAAITNLIGSMSTLGATARTAGAALLSPTTALAGVGLVAAGAVTAFANAEAGAKRLADSLKEGLDPTNLDSIQEAFSRTSDELERQSAVAKEYDSAGGVMKAFGEVLNPFVANRGLDAAKGVEALNDSIRGLLDQQQVWLDTGAGASFLADKVNDLAFNSTLYARGLFTSVEQQDKFRAGMREWIVEAAAAEGIDLSTITGLDKWNQLSPEALKQVLGLADAIGEQAQAALYGTPQTDALAASYETLADQTSSATDKLKAWKDQLDAVFGITLSEFDANTKYVESLYALQAAVQAGGPSLDAYTEAGRKNRDALSASAQAALDHAAAVADTEGMEAATLVLQAHVDEIQFFLEQMGLSPEAAQSFTDAAGLTTENLQKIATDAGTAALGIDAVTRGINNVPPGKTVNVTANTTPAIDALSNVEARVVNMPNAYVRADADTARAEQDLTYLTRPRTVNVSVSGGGFAMRWGGVIAAQHGLVRSGAHLARGTSVMYGEPATGGEAYVPRNGNPQRSKAILRHAAGWYGMAMVPNVAARSPVSGSLGGGGNVQPTTEQLVTALGRVLATTRKRGDVNIEHAVFGGEARSAYDDLRWFTMTGV